MPDRLIRNRPAVNWQERAERAESRLAALAATNALQVEALRVAEDRLRTLTEALEEAERLASEAHDAMWTEGLPVFTAIHGESPASASNCIHRLHAVVRAALAGATEQAKDPDGLCRACMEECRCTKAEGHDGPHACRHGQWRADLLGIDRSPSAPADKKAATT